METAELLGALCRELPGLRAVAEETGEGTGLEEVLAAARRGEPVDGRLRELGLLRLLESWTARTVTMADSHSPRLPAAAEGSSPCPAWTGAGTWRSAATAARPGSAAGWSSRCPARTSRSAPSTAGRCGSADRARAVPGGGGAG
ncbi:hypothetical protein ACFQ2B_32930 [Streptomyces stramineus]